MGVAAETLLNDRWAEFQRLARSKGTLAQEPPPTSTQSADRKGKAKLLEAAADGVDTKKPGGGFMREFFDEIAQIQNTIRSGNEVVKNMDKVLEEIMVATTQDRQKAASDAIQDMVVEANTLIASSKRSLEELTAKSEAQEKLKPSPAENRIRRNMQQAMARKQQQLLLDFQMSQMEFRRILEHRQQSDLQLLCPEASQEEVREMMEAGETAQQLVIRKMVGAHATIFEEVERIRDKHQDILRLEENIRDLSQMFQEVALLVDAQGEMLDNIESNVHSTDAYIVKGIKELETAKKLQHNTRKWQCCLSVFCMLVLLAIFFPVLIKS